MMQVKPSTFTAVVENIAHLVRSRGESLYPNVCVQFLIDRENYAALPRMYELGRSVGADRIAVGLVLNIPNQRIDPRVLLHPTDGEKLRPYLEEILRRDRDCHRLQIDFPVPQWNAMVAEIRQQLSDSREPPGFSTAASFEEKNGHCFFGWYTATIRGNGDLYPCCLLMFPDYKPLGNALNGRFVDQWNGPSFSRLRQEQRDVFLAGEQARFDPAKFETLRPQCVEQGKCYLKNLYFRGDEAFYQELGEALERARTWPGWRTWLRQRAQALAGRTRSAARKAIPADSRLPGLVRRLVTQWRAR
jgi:MoaA/NifB/PqqE/SkfB family radical SAM enzyme